MVILAQVLATKEHDAVLDERRAHGGEVIVVECGRLDSGDLRRRSGRQERW